MPTWVALSASGFAFPGVVVGLVAQKRSDVPGHGIAETHHERILGRVDQLVELLMVEATEEADVRGRRDEAPPAGRALPKAQPLEAIGTLAPSTSLRTVKVECAGLVSAAS